MKNNAIPSLVDLVRADLDDICAGLSEELARMAGKRLLITGGAGFLGHYFVQAPLHWNRSRPPEQAIRVTVYDNYVGGVPTWLKTLEGNRDLTLTAHDLCEPLPQDMPHFDYVIHAACIGSPTYYRRQPIQTMDSNVNGIRNLLDLAVAQKRRGRPMQGLLYLSTSEIYGDPPPEEIPTSEDYRGNVSCTGPRACYDESKRFGETLCVSFVQKYQLQVTVARPFNNYGPGLKITDGRVIPDFARDIFSGRDIIMYSDGSPKRTFCYSADAIVGYYKTLMNGRAGEPYNIGTDRPEISIANLAERMRRTAKDLFGYSKEIQLKINDDQNYLVDNPSRRCPMIDKARGDLGYEAKVSIEEGIRRSIIWYHHACSPVEA